jgi:hypothetical protein
MHEEARQSMSQHVDAGCSPIKVNTRHPPARLDRFAVICFLDIFEQEGLYKL